jgi:hypothetical protein
MDVNNSDSIFGDNDTILQTLIRAQSETAQRMRSCQELMSMLENTNRLLLQQIIGMTSQAPSSNLFSRPESSSGLRRNSNAHGLVSNEWPERPSTARTHTRVERSVHRPNLRDGLESILNRMTLPTANIEFILTQISSIGDDSPQQMLPSTEQIEMSTQTHIFPDVPGITNESPITCPISMEVFERGDEVMLIRSCNHLFKKQFLLRWFGRSSCCPVCRSNILETSSDS